VSVLRLGTFNVAAQAMSWQRRTWAARQDDIRASVDYYGLDVLCVQENGNAERTRQLTNTLYRADKPLRRAPGGGRWRHIYFNNELLHCPPGASGLMKLNAGGTKHAAWAKLTHRATGETFFVTSSHLSASFLGSDAARRREASRLLVTSRKLNHRRYPEIHAGDFNSPSDVTNKVMKPAGYTDALRTADAVTHGSYNTFNGRTSVVPALRTQRFDGEHLDHIYVEKLNDRVVLWSQRSDVGASDHNLVMIAVEL
jgi:endonuclease/exonuclease/phosphatase family metal-dependent hydrolase